MHNTHIRGLGSVSVSVPLKELINVTNISNSNGDSLTLKILCTRNSHHCLRTLDACAHHHLARTRRTRVSRMLRMPTTLTLRRHPDMPNIHSAFNAVARLGGDLHLLFDHYTRRIYPRYKTHIRPDLGITTNLSLTYPAYNHRFCTPDTRSLTFGDNNTYPAYNNANIVHRISRTDLIPSRSGAVGRNTILP